MAKKEYSEQVQSNLKSIIDKFDLEERPVRERQIRLWKKLEYAWSGFSNVYWDDSARDYRLFNYMGDGGESDGGDQAYYDRPINVFRALLETIIAAMSASVPPIKCSPDDAANALDISTAKGGTKIAELIYKHNNAPLLWCHALYVYCTQGLVAAYNYPIENVKFGTVNVDNYKDVEETKNTYVCPFCSMQMDEEQYQIAQMLKADEEDEFQPDMVFTDYENNKSEGQTICPQCQMRMDPEIQSEKVIISRFVGVTQKPKARQKIEILGGLYVKVPNWARSQEDCPYLFYEYETHYTNVWNKYPNLKKKASSKVNAPSTSGNDEYERWGRLSPQYVGEMPTDTPTVRNCWLRPAAFNSIEDDSQREELFKEFPDGVKCVLVNEEYAEACPEALDDYWTLTRNPLSNSIHYDPVGLLLTSIQEITNDMVSLTLQTIEHGIPQTFVNPKAINFKQYREGEIIPGGLYPAKPSGGRTLSEEFYTVSMATLSREVQPFMSYIQDSGQFVSGALPSLIGSSMSSTRTASEYDMSRQQAMQRLNTPWKMINAFWKEIFGKVIPQYIKMMQADERIVRKQGDSFINDVIKKAELDGKIGEVEVESSEDLPISWGQLRASLMGLIELNNPQINEILGSPDNLGVIQKIFGFGDLKIPGEEDQVKQYNEIQLLGQSEPIPDMDEMGMPVMIPSVMPEDFDNHIVHIETCRSWLIGEAGRQAKVDNAAGYQNVVAHMNMHMSMVPPPPMMGANGNGNGTEQPPTA